MMRELLMALRADLLAWGEVGDRVFLTEAQDYVPAALRTPAIGLKDGPVKRESTTGGGEDRAFQVAVMVYADSRVPGEALLGNADPARQQPGLLALCDQVIERLAGNLLGLEGQGFILASLVEEQESVSWDQPGRLLTSKALVFEYQQEA